MSRRWVERPTGSTWGDWGDDDQLGRVNLLTPSAVRRAANEVREGLTFCLSLPLDYPGGTVLNPNRKPPVLTPAARGDGVAVNFPYSRTVPGATDVINDDQVLMHLQYSTQWDGLAHVGSMFDADGDGEPEAVFYNGYRAGEQIDGDASATRHTALGVENMAASCLQGRGVLIDLHAHFGRERRPVGYDELMDVMDRDQVTVEEGDLVLLHTGFSDLLLEMGRKPDREMIRSSCVGLDGRDAGLLQWVTESGLVSLVADNPAVEFVPATEVATGPGLPLHEHCLFKLGVNLGELWNLGPLARWLRAHDRSRFLLTAPPLRLTGAIGSPATPVATV
jgi:hypothetical protein